jgi:enoyl-CoA hydratase
MPYKTILAQEENNILTITINRPDKLNALNKEVFSELREAVHATYTNSSIAAIIITGAGDKAFVAGADIAEFKDFTAEEGAKLSANGHTVFNIIENCPKPVIAAINGFALGGGCELAMACHMRVAADNARFGQPEVNLGVTPGYGGTQRLVRLIGKGKATELLMTGDMLNATDAHTLGLVNYVTTPQELMAKCLEILEKIKTKSPVAISKIVTCVAAYYNKEKDGFQTEINEFGSCFDTEDFTEGTNAFIEKRKPNFPGK